MDAVLHHEPAISLTIYPDLLAAWPGEDIVLTCTVTNLHKMPFRMRKDWDFGRMGDPYGCLTADITRDGKVYEDWRAEPYTFQDRSWSPTDVVVLTQGDAHTFEALFSLAYPLLHHGTYTLQAVLMPAELKGARVSKCKPVLSNLVTIELG